MWFPASAECRLIRRARSRAVRVVGIRHGFGQDDFLVGPQAFHAAHAVAFDVHPDLRLAIAVGKGRNVLYEAVRVVAMPGDDFLLLQVGYGRHCAVGQHAPEDVVGIALPGRENDRGSRICRARTDKSADW